MIEMLFKKGEFQDKAQDKETANQNKNSKTYRQTIDMSWIWKEIFTINNQTVATK